MSSSDPRRQIPRTDALLADPAIAVLAAELGDAVVRAVLSDSTARARAFELPADGVREHALAALQRLRSNPTTMRPVLNATGVIVHTNLGRAPLSPAAVAALVVAAGYVDVEFDLTSGLRADRGRGTLAALLAAVPGAEAALVVNNAAGALSLATTALAQGRELIVSRGELVEIGDGFRIPDLIASTGVVLREVGTTNRTHPGDYEAALGPASAAILKVHPSNYRVQGFTREVAIAECARLARGHGIPLIADIGSGVLRPDPLLPQEPDAARTLADGADLVICSGDKLLGGPQAGLLLGRSELIQRLRRHPLARAFRADKLTLAALEATLRGPRPPVGQALHSDPVELARRTEALRAGLVAARPDLADHAKVVPADGAIGGGGGPGVALPGWALSVSGLPLPAQVLSARLRTGTPALVARNDGGCTLIDLRAVPAAEDAVVLACLQAALAGDH